MGIFLNVLDRIKEAKKEGSTTLNLDKLGLTTELLEQLIPKINEELPNLEVLNLEYNNLERLPLYIDNFKALKVLALSHNYIKDLNPAFEHLENLEELWIGKNSLGKGEKPLTRIARLPLLKRVYLCYNGIRSLPLEFIHHIKAQLIDLKGNPLDESSIRLLERNLTDKTVLLAESAMDLDEMLRNDYMDYALKKIPKLRKKRNNHLFEGFKRELTDEKLIGLERKEWVAHIKGELGKKRVRSTRIIGFKLRDQLKKMFRLKRFQNSSGGRKKEVSVPIQPPCTTTQAATKSLDHIPNGMHAMGNPKTATHDRLEEQPVQTKQPGPLYPYTETTMSSTYETSAPGASHDCQSDHKGQGSRSQGTYSQPSATSHTEGPTNKMNDAGQMAPTSKETVAPTICSDKRIAPQGARPLSVPKVELEEDQSVSGRDQASVSSTAKTLDPIVNMVDALKIVPLSKTTVDPKRGSDKGTDVHGTRSSSIQKAEIQGVLAKFGRNREEIHPDCPNGKGSTTENREASPLKKESKAQRQSLAEVPDRGIGATNKMGNVMEMVRAIERRIEQQNNVAANRTAKAGRKVRTGR